MLHLSISWHLILNVVPPAALLLTFLQATYCTQLYSSIYLKTQRHKHLSTSPKKQEWSHRHIPTKLKNKHGAIGIYQHLLKKQEWSHCYEHFYRQHIQNDIYQHLLTLIRVHVEHHLNQAPGSPWLGLTKNKNGTTYIYQHIFKKNKNGATDQIASRRTKEKSD